MSFAVQSSAFGSGAEIPKKFTCEGPDVSPALEWSGVPQGTATFALIADDPDAPVGTWVHWVIWNMSPDTHGLPEAVPRSAQLDTGAQQGDTTSARSAMTVPVRLPVKRIVIFSGCTPWTANSICRPDRGERIWIAP